MLTQELNRFIIDYSITKKIGLDICYKYNILPLEHKELYTTIATSDPNIDKDFFINMFHRPIRFILVKQQSILIKLDNFKHNYKIYDLVQKSLDVVKNNATKNSYILNLFDYIIMYAIELNSSDIHIEATKEEMNIRFRIDGTLYIIYTFTKKLYRIFSSIIKYYAHLDIAVVRLPQDGRFSKVFSDNEFDFRVSFIPTINGESIAIRILNNKNSKILLKDIGFNKELLKYLKKAINYTNGLILVTGPTGSGKTTTLYSILNRLNKSSKKIITVENPIEYNLDKVQQIELREDIGLSYEIALKSILRQDPDIIMIGEIRDKKALNIAIQAALTGHLVLATLHTTSATQTIHRLLDLGAEPYLIASTLRAVLSQRLVRKISNNNMIKYKGRIIIAELLYCDEKISHMISINKPIKYILDYAKTIGFKTLEDDIKHKIELGITTKEEYYSKILI